MLRTATRLHADQAGAPVREILQEHRAFESLVHDLAGVGIDVVNLEDALGDVDTYGHGLHGVAPVDGEGNAFFGLFLESEWVRGRAF
jgi:hypothetical protein